MNTTPSTQQSVSTYSLPLAASFVCYTLLAVLYSIGAGQLLLASVGICAGILSVILLLSDLTKSLYLLVFVTHIGPVLRVDFPGLAGFTIGDAYLLLFIFAFVSSFAHRRPQFGPFRSFIVPFLVLVFVNAVFAADFLLALPGVLSMAYVAFTYFATLNLISNKVEAKRLLASVAYGVLVSAGMHLHAYSLGRTLLLGMEDGGYVAQLQSSAPGTYAKTAFFYGTFIASCIAVTTVGVRRLMFPERSSKLAVLGWGIVVFGVGTSILVQGTRTGLLCVGLATVLALAMRVLVTMRGQFMLRSLVTPLVVLLVVLGMLVAQNRLLSPEQQMAFPTLMTDDAGTSIGVRTMMWIELPDKIQNFPKEFWLGIGPDLPTRGFRLPEVHRLMLVPSLGAQPFSFHNFYIDIIFNHGVIFFSLVAVILARTLGGLLLLVLKEPEDISADCLLAIVAWLVMWNSHATGWSKPVLILAILMGIAHLELQRGRQSRADTATYVGSEALDNVPYV